MAEERAQRRLAAILAADVVGYSRLMEADEVGTLDALKARRKAILQPLVAGHQGRVFKVAGDSVLIEFASPVNAVQCAVDLQKEMDAANADLPDDRQIVLRIGINLGDVMVEGSDLYGDGINIAARLEGIADAGAILISGTAFDQVRNKIKVNFEDRGRQILKNIAEPVRVYGISRGAPISTLTLTAASDKPSIAVLPFDNLTGDSETTLFADGLAEDIITGLSRIPSLLVISRNSTFTYKGKSVSITDVARDLGVRYVMEGSVRKGGGQVRVTAQLISAEGNAHIWAERFDRSFEKPFELQDEIAQIIVSTMQQQLYLSEGRAVLTRRDRSNTALWTLLHRSWARLHDLTPEAIAEAREMAEQALGMDANSARANFLVGCTLYHEAYMLYRPDYELSIDRARSLIEKSIRLDRNDEHAHWILGGIYAGDGDPAAGIAELERALEINPNWALAISDLGEVLCYSGRAVEGIALIERAIKLNPADPSIFFRFASIAAGYYFSDNFESAERWARKAVQRHRLYHNGHVFLVASLVQLNRLSEAKAAAVYFRQCFPTFVASQLKAGISIEGYQQKLVADLQAAGIPV